MSSSLWRGALLLTAAAVGVKIMSAAYRIPFQNLAGDLGFYVYQQVYPFFAIALFLATYGFPAVVSKMVSGHLTVNGSRGTAGLFLRSFFVIAILATVLFGCLFFGAPAIASWMGDPRLSGPLRTISFCFLFVPFIAVAGGFFQGHENMRPTALSQLLAQLIRASCIIGFAWLAFARGFDPYTTGELAALGSLAGFAVSFVLLAVLLLRGRRLLKPGQIRLPLARLKGVILLDGLVYSVCSLTVVFCLMIDTFTVVPLLGAEPSHALKWMGIYDRGYPLLQLCTAAATSFAVAFVPALSKARRKQDIRYICEKCGQALKLATAFAAAAAAGFAAAAPSINRMLFEDSAGTASLALFGPAMLFASLALVMTAILQALDFTKLSFRHALAGLLCKLALNVMLVPLFGTSGAAAATAAAFAVIAWLDGRLLHQETAAFSFLFRSGGKLILSLAVMTLAVLLSQFALALVFSGGGRLAATCQALIGVAVGIVVFLRMLRRTGYLKTAEVFRVMRSKKAVDSV